MVMMSAKHAAVNQKEHALLTPSQAVLPLHNAVRLASPTAWPLVAATPLWIGGAAAKNMSDNDGEASLTTLRSGKPQGKIGLPGSLWGVVSV